MPNINRITVRGFKSIEALEQFELRQMNVLIGPNGACKSNLLDVFRVMSAISNGHRDLYVGRRAGRARSCIEARSTRRQLKSRLNLVTRFIMQGCFPPHKA